ncbi:hypothetical protein AAMO2058_001179500 [Amorphochlora amoebiformis]|eukprot:1394873-Amorphochlora_amoeboformis.AAC.1
MSLPTSVTSRQLQPHYQNIFDAKYSKSESRPAPPGPPLDAYPRLHATIPRRPGDAPLLVLVGTGDICDIVGMSQIIWGKSRMSLRDTRRGHAYTEFS